MFRQIWYNLGPVTKNLLLMNIFIFVACFLLESKFPEFINSLALYHPRSPNFEPYQLVTHFFMHASFTHLLFNMFGLFMFGGHVERLYGPKKFLSFYLICAMAAAAAQVGFNEYLFQQAVGQFPEGFTTDNLMDLITTGSTQYDGTLTQAMIDAARAINIPMVGASGAISGVVVAFAVNYPNSELVIFPIPIPVKAKYLIPFYLLGSLFMGTANNAGDNIAHFAHLGGALVGLIIAYFWKKNQWRHR